MSATFTPGQLVKVRSGGPPMTIAGYEDQPLGPTGWLCIWTIQGAIRREVLPEAVLEAAEPETQ